MAANDIWITGIGLVSSAGEGRAAHLAALAATAPAALDETSFAPFAIHPSPALELDRQIPKKGDQRQMEPWQRLGTYAAGLAIDDAGARDLVAEMDLIVAAGGGERDIALDDQVLAALVPLPPADAAVKLNEMLAGGLRPTLFLAQLSNLLAGNISIVHGVTGASRTFMGEEQAGADAVRIAAARLAEGSSRIALVGGAYSAARWDMLLLYHAGGLLRHQPAGTPWAPVLSREDAPGAITGTQAAFLVLETEASARARGAKGLARLGAIATGQARRTPADPGHEAMAQAFRRIAPRLGRHHVAEGVELRVGPRDAGQHRLDIVDRREFPGADQCRGAGGGHEQQVGIGEGRLDELLQQAAAQRQAFKVARARDMEAGFDPAAHEQRIVGGTLAHPATMHRGSLDLGHRIADREQVLLIGQLDLYRHCTQVAQHRQRRVMHRGAERMCDRVAEHAELSGREGGRPEGRQREGVRRAHRSVPRRGRK
jgi:3-oxoacyl-[acyl-carrier-protein] synthase II